MSQVTEPNRAPSTTWMLRHPDRSPNGMVKTLPSDYIGIGVWGDLDVGSGVLTLTRRDARLLARRINQCLDATAKR